MSLNKSKHYERRYDYQRSISCALLILVVTVFCFSEFKFEVWHAVLPFFEWLETTVLGYAAKTWGGLFAVVEAFHLLAMALLGGAIITTEGRGLNLLFKNTNANMVFYGTHKLFVIGLSLACITGLFMMCGVALKVYYLSIFWLKMLALLTGVLFYFFIRYPLLQQSPNDQPKWLRHMMCYASLCVWFLVAASGRWIGFS